MLTRLFTPSDFGALAVFSAVVTIMGAVCTLRLETAVSLPKTDLRAASVAWTALGIAAVSTMIFLIIGIAASEPIAVALGAPVLARYWWLLALTMFAIGAGQVLAAWMVRTRRYDVLGRRVFAQGVGQVLVSLSLGALAWRPVGILLGLFAGRVAGLGGLVSARGLLHQRRPRWREVRSVLSRYRRFPLIASWSALLNTAGAQAPLLLISALYGQVAVGFVALTVRVLAAPAAVIGQSVAQVYLGEAGAASRARTAELHHFVKTTVRWLMLVGLPPTIIILLFGYSLFGFLFGPQWAESGHYAQILSVGYLAQFAVSPISQTLLLMERQDIQLRWDILRLLLSAGGPIVCFVVGAPVVVAIVALSASSVAGFGVLYMYCKRYADLADREVLSGVRGTDAGIS
ncbi:lipopolysaccharide biosynthesis protein [Saccharopolyspora aridisoli]|uniref:lipopolysaccharide biosynthesis protein n=1 Tax=Saccharopolyspora aridisoli TaxID=2530385 RepID=UPI001404DF75|nr:oligosaccharide flippase family protein [Saccharopolyspora aridisoli]